MLLISHPWTNGLHASPRPFGERDRVRGISVKFYVRISGYHTMKKIRILFPLTMLLIFSFGLAMAQSREDHQSAAEQAANPAALDLADVVPRAAALTGRLADLENRIRGGLDIASVEKQYDGIEARLQELVGQLEAVRQSQKYKYNQLVELKGAIHQESESYEVISRPIRQAIRELENWRTVWLSDQKRWDEWQSSLQKEGDFEQLRTTVEKANGTITTALERVLSRLGAVLALQERGGRLQDQINTLDVELSRLIVNERRSTLLDESPPMLSAQFLSAFKSGEIWSAAIQGPEEITWPDSRFFARHGWIVLLQVVLTLFVTISTCRNRSALNESKRWRFFAARPFSAGLFVGYMLTVVIYESMETVPETWKLAMTMVAAISFARLMGALTDTPWKRQFINGLMVVLIATLVMDALSFPIPLFRLYTAVTAVVGLIFCWRLAGATMRDQVTVRYRWLLRSGALFFAVIVIAELWGKRALASYLFASSIDSLATVMVFILFMVIIRGALEWLFHNASLRQASAIYSEDTDTIIGRLAHLINLAIVGLVLLPAILMIWGVYDSLTGATKALLSLGFSLGAQRISVGLLLVAIGILYASLLASWILQKLLADDVRFKHRLEKGVRISIGRLAHYAIIIAGFLFALSTLGFEISKITIMLSALGVGIGFGLQGIVNNFVSGLILLFERPVRVGDVIQITGGWAEIKNIGIRATTVQTFDRADRIIPNADLIANEVTNWTLTNRQIRLIIPVGVAYGSDVDRVTESLMSCAQTNPKVAKRPSPKVLFLNFGESTLDFELRVFVAEFDQRIDVRDALNRQIDRSFRDANIEIAFPQRDLHLRSVDGSISLKASDA